MKHNFLRVIIVLAVQIACLGLGAQTEVHPFIQDGLAPARQITFDIQPFGPEDGNRLVVVGLEGLSMAIINQGHAILVDSGEEQVAVPPMADGWYRFDVVKRYFSQDIEVAIDGYPVFLALPNTALDMFLPEDRLIVAGEDDFAGQAIGSLSVRNLDTTPSSIFDFGDLSSTGKTLSPGDSGTGEAALDSAPVESGESGVDPQIEAGVSFSEEAEDLPAEAESTSSSRLFTPLL